MNPLIKEYVETTTAHDELIKKYVDLEPNNRLYKELYEVSLLLKAPRSKQSVFHCDDAFLFEYKYDKDLVGLYYQFCARLALYYENHKLASLCYRHSDSYFDKETPPYVALPTKAALIFGQPLYAFLEDHFVNSLILRVKTFRRTKSIRSGFERQAKAARGMLVAASAAIEFLLGY